MRVVREGHNYALENMEGGEQTLQFIEKVQVEGADELQTVMNGTTNEEVLAMMVDRMVYLEGKMSCKENQEAILHLDAARSALAKRTKRRKKAGVEGTRKPH